MQDREQAFEAKFVHDEEMQFMIRARRDKLFARWAAHELGLGHAETEALVAAIVHIKDDPAHDAALLDTVAAKLAGHPGATREALAAALNRCLAEAHAALDATPHGTTADPA